MQGETSPRVEDEFEDDFDIEECWHCGGEGFVSSCFEEFACIDPDAGCDLCTRRCDVCRPMRSAPATPSKEG